MTSPSNPITESQATTETSSNEDSMKEYYQLKNNLLLVTLTLTGIIFISVWVIYGLNIALNYLLGGCVGVVYLRMLAKEVERIGNNKRRFGSGRLALVVGLIVAATRWQQLEILPIILGFMTYKATILFYVLPNSLLSAQQYKDSQDPSA